MESTLFERTSSLSPPRPPGAVNESLKIIELDHDDILDDDESKILRSSFRPQKKDKHVNIYRKNNQKSYNAPTDTKKDQVSYQNRTEMVGTHIINLHDGNNIKTSKSASGEFPSSHIRSKINISPKISPISSRYPSDGNSTADFDILESISLTEDISSTPSPPYKHVQKKPKNGFHYIEPEEIDSLDTHVTQTELQQMSNHSTDNVSCERSSPSSSQKEGHISSSSSSIQSSKQKLPSYSFFRRRK